MLGNAAVAEECIGQGKEARSCINTCWTQISAVPAQGGTQLKIC